MGTQRLALHAEERRQQHRLMLQRFEHNRKEAPPPPPPTRLERALEKERTMVLPPHQRTKCVGVVAMHAGTAFVPGLTCRRRMVLLSDRVMKMKPVEAACNPSMRTYSSFAQAAKKVRLVCVCVCVCVCIAADRVPTCAAIPNYAHGHANNVTFVVALTLQ